VTLTEVVVFAVIGVPVLFAMAASFVRGVVGG